jgi:hypothetical protein
MSYPVILTGLSIIGYVKAEHRSSLTQKAPCDTLCCSLPRWTYRNLVQILRPPNLQVFGSSKMKICRHGVTIWTAINRSTVSIPIKKTIHDSDNPSIAKFLRNCCVSTLLLNGHRHWPCIPSKFEVLLSIIASCCLLLSKSAKFRTHARALRVGLITSSHRT